MVKYDRNYFKNTMLLDKYFSGYNLVLTRFNTIEDIASKLDKDFEDYGIRVKEYDFKIDYNCNDFQDYELMIVMGNKEEDFIDITIYYANTRIGEKIITEISYEII